MLEKEIPDLNIFMMCMHVNPHAYRSLPEGFHIRTCRKDELDLWKAFPFDSHEDGLRYADYMSEYYHNVYAAKETEFLSRCLFLCEDDTDAPAATCFAWKAYDRLTSIHWFKTLKPYEGRGLGRALLTYVMQSIEPGEYPVFLHTQPSSFRAIGLYSSFGFQMVTNETFGYRKNDYKACLPILKEFMTEDAFRNLTFTKASSYFDAIAKSSKISQF